MRNNRRGSFRHMQRTRKRPDALQENHPVRILLAVIGIRLRGLRQKVQEMSAAADLIHAPASSLHPTTAPWRFSTWAFDIIGPLVPTVENT
ncbi:hypothetical protein MRB53_005805 [Persea americana]|uniref:Uncharacterized protein n=1 Tax=Persea americana TaxID=3435 RepID=A0ACC2MFZ7_PERAE|nr:hypothetical protein MRB53_005805 [Persea americana]